MTEMLELHAEDSYEIRGRGRVYAVRSPVEFDRDKALETFGPEVVIDGVTHRVKGVESHCVPVIRKGSPIGILVSE